MTDQLTLGHPKDLPTLIDPIGEVLHQLRLTGTFYCQAELTAPWGINIPPKNDAMSFLVVTEGSCVLRLEGEDPTTINRGDFVLMTGGTSRQLSSVTGGQFVDLAELPIQKLTDVFETLQYGAGGDVTRGIYGIVQFNHVTGQHLMEMLPPIFKIDTWGAEASLWLQSTLQFIAMEAKELRPGGETVVTRLADVIVIEAIRRWINTAPEANKGWLKGMRDSRIGAALLAIHRSPEQNWSLESLSKTAGMSRSAFAARFADIVGQPAMHYLINWRMRLARMELLETSDSILVISGRVGYNSEPAFSRAFKRVFNVSPQGIRQRKPNHSKHS